MSRVLDFLCVLGMFVLAIAMSVFVIWSLGVLVWEFFHLGH